MKKLIITMIGVIFFYGIYISNLNLVKVKSQEFSNEEEYNIEKSEIWELAIDEDGNEILKSNLGMTIREAVRFNEAGELEEVSLTEYLNILNNNSIDSNNIMDRNNIDIENRNEQIKEVKSPNEIYKYYYKQTSVSSPYGSGIKVTANVAGGASGATISYGYNELIGATYGGSASVNYEVKKALTTGVSFNWNHSVTTNTSFGVTFKVRPNKVGYVQFKPKVTYTKGSAYKDVYNGAGIKIRTEGLGIAEGKSPNKLSNGFADGIFSLVER